VTSAVSRFRPRPGSRPGAFFVLSLAFGVAGAATGITPGSAQVLDTIPVRADTMPLAPTLPLPQVDTLPTLPGDTLAADTVAAEPPRDPPLLVPLRPVGPPGWGTGVWEWGRADLLRLPNLSLLHLLERIPGITPVRITSVGQPEGASVFGAAAAAIRYEIDGFVLDPLSAPTFDPSRVALVALEGVRVERRVTGATVRIRTVSPVDPVAYSAIEAGTGDYRTNLFRGTFLSPNVLGGGVAVGFESLGSQAMAAGASSHLAGWLQWTWVRDDAGIQLQYRQSDMTRHGVGPGLEGTRRDWVVRARTRAGPLVAEGYAGASSVEDDLVDIVLREGTSQGGVRLRFDAAVPLPIEATAAVRLRSHPRLPAREVELAAWTYPVPWLALGAEVEYGQWNDASPTSAVTGVARAGPAGGMTVTAGLFRVDDRLVESAPHADQPDPLVGSGLTREGARFGLEFQRGGWLAAAAVVRTSLEPAAGFGLAFDVAQTPEPGGDASGVEAMVRIPTGWHPLRLEGWYVGMDVPDAWPYFPSEQWTAALVYHHVPLPSGNLEIYGRADHGLRSAMRGASAGGWVPVGAYRASNLELTIRIMTVRAFVRWQNVSNRPFQEDVPGFRRPGQHVFYGVKWEFLN
jgi:hypothetical protein